jgi:predicted permease
VPVPLDDTLRLLGQAATPAALFTLGAIVARAQMRAMAQPGGETSRLGGLLIPVCLKLLVHPALVWGMGLALKALGHPLSEIGLVAVTLAAALPAAANVSMLAEREGAETGLIARIILWTTAGSVLTLLGWCAVLGVEQAA